MAREPTGARAPRAPRLLRTTATIIALLAAVAQAAVTPTFPGPGASFNEGGDCSIRWTLDSTANTVWTNFDIDLMTGANLAMINVTRVGSGLDGTAGTGLYTYPCPNVTPNSAIYFYQFTVGGLDPQWTTRFTIAGSGGTTVAPAHAAQGTKVPAWGVGKLVGAQPSNTAMGAAQTSAASTATDDGATATATTDDATPTSTDTADATTSTSAAAAATTTAASHKSTSTGLFAGLKPTFRYIIYAAIGVLGALILGLITWGLCVCCKRTRAKPTDKNYVPPKITHHVPPARSSPSQRRSPQGKYGEMDTSIDTWVEPPSPYEEKYGGGRADERWEMAPTGAAHQAQASYHGGGGGRTPPPGWTEPAQYNYSHSAVSFADDTPLVKPLTQLGRAPTQQGYALGRPGMQRAPSSASSHHNNNQRNRYTQQQVEGYGQDQGDYEREQQAAWNALPQRGPGQQQQSNWI